MTTMECTFEKIFNISSELLRMQEFWTFTNRFHELANGKKNDCDIDRFLKKLKDVLFNEELSYDKRRIHFIESCLAQISVLMQCFSCTIKEKKRLKELIRLLKILLSFFNSK